jgi:peptide/nickel transport system substrate-binding protein
VRLLLARAGILGAVALVGAFLLPSAGTPRAIKEGGTFRMAEPDPVASADPALVGNFGSFGPACGTLMGYPSKPLPEGLRLVPELAASNPRISQGGLTYTFLVSRSARFSTGQPVTAADVKNSLERILTPALQSFVAYLFEDVVGARRMASGKATSLAGVTARGRALTVRLARPVPDLPARTTQLCIVPRALQPDPEGVKAPIPSAAPYYVSEFVPGERVTLERNPYYGGRRPHHVDRIVSDFGVEPDAGLDAVQKGQLDFYPVVPGTRVGQLVREYGINRSRLFVEQSLAGRSFFLNTSRPLFRDNVPLRKAVNLAVDRAALIREFGGFGATATDQILPPGMPGFQNAKIYPLGGPDARRARALAAGHLRKRKAVLYTCSEPGYCVAPAQVLQRNLKAIGLRVEIKTFPRGIYFQKAQTLGEPYDMILIGWSGGYNDPREFLLLFDGRSGAQNYSRFNSPVYNRLLDVAGHLSVPARYRAYGSLDVRLMRDEAPAIPYAVYNDWKFVSERVGCVVQNPSLDLTAVCLK